MNIHHDEESTPHLMSSSCRGLATSALAATAPGTGREEDYNNKLSSPNSLRLGATLKIATWNCGGLTSTQRDLCAEEGYDILKPMTKVV